MTICRNCGSNIKKSDICPACGRHRHDHTGEKNGALSARKSEQPQPPAGMKLGSAEHRRWLKRRGLSA